MANHESKLGMEIALTGGTGFIGRYIIGNLLSHGHQLRCWKRPESETPMVYPCINQTKNTVAVVDSPSDSIRWINGDLSTCETAEQLVEGCDAVIHNAFWRPGARFQGEEGDIAQFVSTNVVGSLKLIEVAKAASVEKFVYVSSCSVHEKILADRPLDESHPLWPKTHYGAHKAAIEKFVHSYGLGEGYGVCAVRPTGVYGAHHHTARSKWFDLIKAVVAGESVECVRGGKEVHAADVAESIRVLLDTDIERVRGEVFACYDRYVSQFEVASLAKKISGSNSIIKGEATFPKHEIVNSKIKSIGMEFGGERLLHQTIEQLVTQIQANA